MKRITPYDDPDRLMENMLRQGYTIKDRTAFNKAWEDYMDSTTPLQENVLKVKVWNALRKKRDLKQEDETQIKRKGRKINVPKRDKITQEYQFLGMVKNRIVYAKEDILTIKGRRQRVFRDNKGRFVSMKVK